MPEGEIRMDDIKGGLESFYVRSAISYSAMFICMNWIELNEDCLLLGKNTQSTAITEKNPI